MKRMERCSEIYCAHFSLMLYWPRSVTKSEFFRMEGLLGLKSDSTALEFVGNDHDNALCRLHRIIDVAA